MIKYDGLVNHSELVRYKEYVRRVIPALENMLNVSEETKEAKNKRALKYCKCYISIISFYMEWSGVI